MSGTAGGARHPSCSSHPRPPSSHLASPLVLLPPGWPALALEAPLLPALLRASALAAQARLLILLGLDQLVQRHIQPRGFIIGHSASECLAEPASECRSDVQD